MTNHQTPSSASTNTNWPEYWAVANCPHCDWTYRLPLARIPLVCPHCGQERLLPIDAATDAPDGDSTPELVVPFATDAARLQPKLAAFAKGVWFRPEDLQPQTLISRLQAVYLPMWLVDSDVQAQWQAEMGFDYEVVSHQSRFDNNNWQTREVKEGRVRWEPRLGTLQRHYANRAAPALEEHEVLLQRLGQFDVQASRPYQPNLIEDAIVRLPNRAPSDAWVDAAPIVQRAAAAECQQAAASQHIRDFRWQPTYTNQNWTQLLLPAYATFYRDDDGEPQTLLIHGQTGRVNGRRRASKKRARVWSLSIGTVAGLIFLVSLLLALLGWLEILPAAAVGLALLGAMLGIFVGLAALFPLVYVWNINRKN